MNDEKQMRIEKILSLLSFRSSEAVRYDPTREDHKQFEQEKKKPEKKEPEKKKKEEKKTKKNQQEQDQPMLPEVSQERYHSVESTSLAERFANKNQVSGPLFIVT